MPSPAGRSASPAHALVGEIGDIAQLRSSTVPVMSSFEYDLMTIGAGSGGVAASRYAASKGARVAICEADRVGGTCVIRGCVPKKIFMYAAQFADAFADAVGYGWRLPQADFDLARLTAAKDADLFRIEGIYRRMLADSGVRLIAGRA